ncbi:MAG: 16S rRNA (adenine(1518)-N(6)/adenine(1519)-N(6))-dimethyltransferase RsmA [Bacteroidales bacterium]|jgi:16S rRNA (adenine1518-N6/adenine1519-N6)-dimethyltransferase|nr:16S rRNA (adenine(1518)-N(6)/adenine(1519)-N(6))-dimethyltransferase RsmA [Bacteroidales bacterium]
MNKIRPKKNLGQHFLRDRNIAQRIAGSLTGEGYESVLEIGPGTGMLTEFILKRAFPDFRVIEIDNESFYFLREKYPQLREIIRGDFLDMDIDSCFNNKIAVIGNFPYNISSQILFKILDHRDKVVEVCGMFQKEMAERICASSGSRMYGILSVLIHAYYSTEYLFTVEPDVFVPRPKVRSGVVRLRRNTVEILDCDEALFIKVVKAAFNQRRKILRNSIRAVFKLKNEDYGDLNLRPEQLSVDQFVSLTNWVKDNMILSE